MVAIPTVQYCIYCNTVNSFSSSTLSTDTLVIGEPKTKVLEKIKERDGSWRHGYVLSSEPLRNSEK